jgi:cellulose synthase/poly-beta-1,6-N-acetylglucosamine synthase-like glycosyltransferase
MSMVLDAILLALALAAAVPSAVFFWECVLGALYRPKPRPDGEGAARPRIAVLVPAHNESSGVTPTLQGLRAQLRDRDVLLVVADNCDDDTAAVAAASGARVVERHDPSRRGKGYALIFGLEKLAEDPPDVVVIVDADCQVSEGGIERIARQAHATDRPVQADYVLVPSAAPSARSVISALAFLIKNRVRPRGLDALGMPVLLTGTGMGFPWAVLRKAPPTEDHLVEDMVMGLELALLGHAPRLCPDAHVTSALPEGQKAASAQRKRWEHGHLATLIAHGPKLMAAGLTRGRGELIALALDLMVPPLSLLVALLLAGSALCAAALLLGAATAPLAIFACSLFGIALAVLVGWSAYGRRLVRARDLWSIPLYVLWKLPLYFGFFVKGKQRVWERTERSADPSRDTPG